MRKCMFTEDKLAIYNEQNFETESEKMKAIGLSCLILAIFGKENFARVGKCDFNTLYIAANDAIANLTKMEQSILRQRFGLDGKEQQTLKAIAVDYNLVGERIRQKEKEALRKLRFVSRSKEIRRILNLTNF